MRGPIRVAAQLLMDEIRGDSAGEKKTVLIKPDLLPRRSTLGDAWRRD